LRRENIGFLVWVEPEEANPGTTLITEHPDWFLRSPAGGASLLDLGNPEIETTEIVADRIRQGLKYVAADRLIPAPDCGMKYMPRQTAFGKLKAMCDAAAIVRKEIS